MNRQLALAIKLNDEATLADFNWGNNPLLQQQLHSMLTLEAPKPQSGLQYQIINQDPLIRHCVTPSPRIQGEDRLLYLWGAKGCGKSHLLQACCQAVNSTQSAIYLPLNLLKEWGPQTIEGLEDQTLICIDDIDAIAHDPAWEEALFHLYNKIKDRNEGLLIISGNQPPTAMPIHLADLRSRLGWGLVIQLLELSDEDKINSLKLHALKRGFDLPESVGQFLLNRCSRNMHDLHQLLNLLDDASLAAQRKITIPFVKDTLNI